MGGKVNAHMWQDSCPKPTGTRRFGDVAIAVV